MASRFSTGWTLAKESLSVIKKNRKLLIFPILSGAALLITTGSFILILLAGMGWETDAIIDKSTPLDYLLAFGFYLLNYFIIVFFNMALIHCARLYFEGEEVTVSKGISYSMSRLPDIFAWAVLAATVGLILKVLEENLGKIGQLISGMIGMAWSITTFFVVPVIAYEKLNPIDALKRSAEIMKKKWGESLVASFGFGLIKFLAILIVAIPVFTIAIEINLFLGITLGLLSVFLIYAVFSAAETIFIAAVYQRVSDKPVPDFNLDTLDSAFVVKQKKNFL